MDETILIRSRREEPLREAGVRAVVPGRPGLRGPEAGKAAGWAARTGSEAGASDGLRVVPRPGLVATS